MNEEKISLLENLAGYFSKPLYVVGGAVRNALLGLPSNDIDLACAIPSSEVFTLLEGSPFEVCNTSLKLFTLKISHKNVSFEYTSFRRDSYSVGGKHVPDFVEVTEDIGVDAKRRDFKINAIYYDILARKIVDPLNGRRDLELRQMSTTVSPEEVFSQDGLRLMRLARQAAQLGFSIEERTKAVAKEFAYLIKDIAAERLCEEFKKILSADLAYNVQNGEIAGLRYLDELGIMKYILPEITETKGCTQPKSYHEYDVFEHTMHVVAAAPPEVRTAALFHDMAKPVLKRKTGSMRGHDVEGGRMAENIMHRLRFSNAEIEETVRLVSNHMFDYKLICSEKEVRSFVQQNYDIIDKLVLLMIADRKGKGRTIKAPSLSAERLRDTYEKMTAEGIPFEVSELLVKGEDLISYKVPEKMRGRAMKALLRATANDLNLLSRENQLQFIKKYENRD